MYKKTTKEELITILKGLLKTEEDASFLLKLEKVDLEKLVSLVRERLGGMIKFSPQGLMFDISLKGARLTKIKK